MVSPDEIVVSHSPGEWRIAVLAAGRPLEFFVDRGLLSPGDVVLGRVLSVNRRLDAAFVDIGEPNAGFLPRPGAVTEGEAVLVQVGTSARGDKGAALTAAVSFQGRFLAFSPFRPGCNLSRRITDPGQRTRLRQFLEPLLAEGEGVVARTAAEAAAEDDLATELDLLRNRWRALRAASTGTKAPRRLDAPPLLARILAGYPDIEKVRVDDHAGLAKVRQFCPGAVVDADCFEEEVGEDFEQILGPNVPLPDGGRLVIEQTSAVVAIDIDSGGGAPIRANLAAMPEIARQLRLRGLSGHILIDAIPCPDRREQRKVVEALHQAVAADPTPTHVIGVTPLGMIEVTRERRFPGPAEVMLAEGEPSLNSETIALAALRAAFRQGASGRSAGKALRLGAAPMVIAWLRRRQDLLDEVARRLGRPLLLAETTPSAPFEIVEE
jgi:ribonuclease E/ribonuclease G